MKSILDISGHQKSLLVSTQILEVLFAMSRQSYTAFQRHLQFFATPTNPPRLTFTSALKGACALGLDFPVSVVLSLGLKLLYTPLSLTGIDITDIAQSSHRSQLSNVTLPIAKKEFTCSELLRLLDQERNPGTLKHKIDQGHIVGVITALSTYAIRRSVQLT